MSDERREERLLSIRRTVSETYRGSSFGRILDQIAELHLQVIERGEDADGQLKDAFVAGCCAVLTWTHSGMPQDDLDEAGYDYVANLRAKIRPS